MITQNDLQGVASDQFIVRNSSGDWENFWDEKMDFFSPPSIVYSAADWKLEEPAWSGRMKITAKGKLAYIKLEDKNTGKRNLHTVMLVYWGQFLLDRHCGWVSCSFHFLLHFWRKWTRQVFQFRFQHQFPNRNYGNGIESKTVTIVQPFLTAGNYHFFYILNCYATSSRNVTRFQPYFSWSQMVQFLV